MRGDGSDRRASEGEPGPPLDEEERDELVRKRRLWRRVKAIGALALGVGAGTFLACYSAVTRAPVRTLTPDPATDASRERPSSSRPPADGGAMDAGASMDAGTGAAFPSWPTTTVDGATGVDVDEHRRGMPVPDNLLE